MPAALTFDAYGGAIGSAATVLRANAGASALEHRVPTCPEWTVRDLVLHQGMVHRWATTVVSGGPVTDGADQLAEGAVAPDLLDWFDEGATALLQALSTAPADLDVPFFLRDAGRPRDAWARRQAHETTIHAVDAMAARLGRAPHAAEVWFPTDLALDGIDELLLGFLPRGRSPLRSPEPRTLRIAPAGAPHVYAVSISTEPPRTARVGAGASGLPTDTDVSGTAKDLYLALWNRGGDVEVTGDRTGVDLWHDQMRVSW
ncbi:MAG: maleylpyruvate isomerase family mycothiol-dependent enzyme [Nostocoides sp.]